MAADAAADRRHYMGEFNIELCGLQRAFGLGLGGTRRLQRLTGLVDHLFGELAGLHESQAALEIALGKLPLGARVGELPFGLQHDRLERARIDGVKQIASADDRAILELYTIDEAADAGTDLNLLDRLEATGELVPVGNGPFDRLRHRHRRRRRRAHLRLRLLVAASEREREQHTDRCAAASAKPTAIEPGRRSRILRFVSHSHFRLPKGPRMLQLNWTGRHCFISPSRYRQHHCFALLFQRGPRTWFSNSALQVRLRSSTSIAVAWRASAWVGALVLPLVIFGMIEASITRRPSTPRTLSLASTTARASWPIRHVPTG